MTTTSPVTVLRPLAPRPWLPDVVQQRVAAVAEPVAALSAVELQGEVERLVQESHRIHDVDCLNLNPATNLAAARQVSEWRSGFSDVHFTATQPS